MHMEQSGVGIASRGILGLAVALSLYWSSGAAWAQEKSAACKPVETAVFANRIHVQCEFPVDGKFLFFAAPTLEPKFANRALSVILSAQMSGKVVTVVFDPLMEPVDGSGNTFGCLANDCRRLLAISMADGMAAPPPPPPPPTPQPPPPSAAHRQCLTTCANKFDACESAASTTPAIARCRRARASCETGCPP